MRSYERLAKASVGPLEIEVRVAVDGSCTHYQVISEQVTECIYALVDEDDEAGEAAELIADRLANIVEVKVENTGDGDAVVIRNARQGGSL